MAKPAPALPHRREEAPPSPPREEARRSSPPTTLTTLVGVAKRPEGWALVELELAADDPRLRIVHDRLPRANALEAAVLRHQRLFALEAAGRRGRR